MNMNVDPLFVATPEVLDNVSLVVLEESLVEALEGDTIDVIGADPYEVYVAALSRMVDQKKAWLAAQQQAA